MADNPLHFRMIRISCNQDSPAFFPLFSHNPVDLGNKRTGGICTGQGQCIDLFADRAGNAMAPDDQCAARRCLFRGLHNAASTLCKVLQGLGVMNNGAERTNLTALLQQLFDHGNRAVYAEAKACGFGDKNFQCPSSS